MDLNIISDIIKFKRRFKELINKYFRRVEKLFIKIKLKQLKFIIVNIILNRMVRDN